MSETTALTVAEARPAELRMIQPVVSDPGELIAYHEKVSRIVIEALTEGTDWGKIPGVDKPCLLQPGAERLAIAFGLTPTFEFVETEIDHDREVQWTKRRSKPKLRPAKYPGTCVECGTRIREGEPQLYDGETKTVTCRQCADTSSEPGETEGTSIGLYRYVVRCRLIDRATGLEVAVALGEASTLESRYIDRPRDCEQTVLQISQKRAFVTAIRRALGLSDRFTDGLDDRDAPEGDSRPSAKRDERTADPQSNDRPRRNGRRDADADADDEIEGEFVETPEKSDADTIRRLTGRLSHAYLVDDIDALKAEAVAAVRDGLIRRDGEGEGAIRKCIRAARARAALVTELTELLEGATTSEELEAIRARAEAAEQEGALRDEALEAVQERYQEACERVMSAAPADEDDLAAEASPNELEG